MSNYKVTDSQLTAIADAIRAKTGESGTIVFPTGFVSEIGSITTGDAIHHTDLPAYLKTEVERVVGEIYAVKQPDSILFMAGSDSHYNNTSSDSEEAITGATQAMKALAYALPLDFTAFLGDFTVGASTTTLTEGTAEIKSVSDDLYEAIRDMPQFRTTGNHDPLGRSRSLNGSTLSPETLYPFIGKWNADTGATMGSTTWGYCYRDFASKSLRVICLNTAEVSDPTGDAENISATQKAWFADKLKTTPQNYGIIILSHHPLDWGEVNAASAIVKAYVDGGSISINNETISFAGYNNAAYVLAFHGHTHCFKTDSLYYISNSVGTPYNVKRIATPNICPDRNNEYGASPGYFGIVWGEATTYSKTLGGTSAECTSFCVYCVNPTEQHVHAIHFGAGYDRDVYWGQTSVAVTGVTLNANSGTLAPNASVTLTATVAPADATNKTVLWTTSNSSVATVANGVVTAHALGSATITVTTQDGGYTATYALTVANPARGNLRDYFGYTDGKRISTSDGTYRDKTGGTVVEYIDMSEFWTSEGIVIKTKYVNFQQVSNPYNDNAYVFYNASHGYTTGTYLTSGSNNHGHIEVTRSFAGDADNTMTLTITGITSAEAAGNYHYLRICGLGNGADLDIRVNEDFS